LADIVRQAFIILWLLAMAFSSCEPTGDFIPDSIGAEFFPLQTGAWTEYDVDSVSIALNVQTHYQYQLRLEVKGQFDNATGTKSFLIQRLKRTDPSSSWTPVGTWSAWTDARSAVLVEGNQRFVRLRFPVQVGNEWNGNELNSKGGDDDCGGTACDRYEVTEVEPDVVVVQSDIKDVLVKYDVRKEVYGKDIGLVYKEATVLEYCTSETCFGKQFVDKGVKYKQTLVDHGTI
jgi:hypothetical protein